MAPFHTSPYNVSFVIVKNHLSFGIVKSHVIPHSTALWLIPRKEMVAVVVRVRIAVIAMKALSLGLHEFHMWTDSMTVLNWIINPAIRPIQFIRRKLDKLDGLEKQFQKVCHHYVPMKIKPAVVASRGLNLLRAREERIALWLTGPLAAYSEI